jgi:hypothetical protein
MPRKPHQSSRIGPEAADALSDLREGLERAHELVAEAKLTMRQLGEDKSAPDSDGVSRSTERNEDAPNKLNNLTA